MTYLKPYTNAASASFRAAQEEARRSHVRALRKQALVDALFDGSAEAISRFNMVMIRVNADLKEAWRTSEVGRAGWGGGMRRTFV